MEAIEILPSQIREFNGITLAVGHDIHLKGRKGVFRIVNFVEEEMVLTCYNWQLLAGFPKEKVTKKFPLDDFLAFEEIPKWIQHTLSIA